jgi:hypothetical protein
LANIVILAPQGDFSIENLNQTVLIVKNTTRLTRTNNAICHLHGLELTMRDNGLFPQLTGAVKARRAT